MPGACVARRTGMAHSSERGAPGRGASGPASTPDSGPGGVTPLGHERTLAAPRGPPQDEGTPMSPARLEALTAGLPQVAREVYTLGPEVAQGGIGRVLRAR